MEARALFRIDDLRDRITALEGAAGLTAAHENAPSVEVARFLAQALEEDEPQLRVVAIGLLAEGQDVATAEAALVRAAKGLERFVQRVQRRREPRGDSAEAERERSALASARLYAELLPATLAGALARMATPATRAALEAWDGPWNPRVAEALATVASAEAVRAILRGLAEAPEGDRDAYEASLQGIARRRALEGPPTDGTDAVERWTRWLEANEAALDAVPASPPR